MKSLKILLAGGIFSFVLGGAPFAAFAQSYPYYYNSYYPGVTQQLTCSANVSTVAVGQSVTFTATGGWSSVYNWSTPERSYLNVGPQLTVALFTPGTHAVVVSSGAQTAACSITVTGQGGYTNPPFVYQPTYPVTQMTSQYVPSLPNTGFAPLTAVSFVLAAVLLIAGALFVSPYVTRTIASTFR